MKFVDVLSMSFVNYFFYFICFWLRSSERADDKCLPRDVVFGCILYGKTLHGYIRKLFSINFMFNVYWFLYFKKKRRLVISLSVNGTLVIAVLDLWENQWGGGGGSNVFWLILTIFSGGHYKLGGWEAPDGGVKPSNPPTNRALSYWDLGFNQRVYTFNYIVTLNMDAMFS